jgi:hypothetical protein
MDNCLLVSSRVTITLRHALTARAKAAVGALPGFRA